MQMQCKCSVNVVEQCAKYECNVKCKVKLICDYSSLNLHAPLLWYEKLLMRES